jgi:signal recognition particle receptor subunit beta
MDFRNAMPIVIALNNKDLGEELTSDHWQQIFKKIGNEINVRAEDFKLRNLIEMNIVEFMEDIRYISTQATQEKKLKEELASVKIEWNKQELTFTQAPNVKKAGEGNILTGIDDLNTKMDELMS